MLMKRLSLLATTNWCDSMVNISRNFVKIHIKFFVQAGSKWYVLES